MLKLTALPVPPFLENIALRYLVFEGNLAAGQVFVNDVIPALTEFITFNLNDTPQLFKDGKNDLILSGCHLTGLQSQPFEANLSGNINLVALQLKPPVLSRLFDVPVKNMVNTALDLRDVIGVEAEILCNQIIEMGTVPRALPIIEKFILSRLLREKISSGHHTFQQAHEFIAKSHGTMTINALSARTNRSQRSLERIFIDQTGLSPKVFSKLHRFTHVIQHFNTHKILSPDLIHSLGYYDQSHFINDFKRFSGKSPLEYFKNHEGVNAFFTSWK